MTVRCLCVISEDARSYRQNSGGHNYLRHKLLFAKRTRMSTTCTRARRQAFLDPDAFYVVLLQGLASDRHGLFLRYDGQAEFSPKLKSRVGQSGLATSQMLMCRDAKKPWASTIQAVQREPFRHCMNICAICSDNYNKNVYSFRDSGSGPGQEKIIITHTMPNQATMCLQWSAMLDRAAARQRELDIAADCSDELF